MKSLITITSCLLVVLSCANSNENLVTETIPDSLEQEIVAIQDTSTINTITFSVDSVEIAPELIQTTPLKVSIQNTLGKEIIHFPKEHHNLELVPVWGNGLIETIQECYDNHRPLVLNPDLIWLAICQGVSQHINENFDDLESAVFKENKPKELIARNDSLSNDPEEWSNLIADVAKQTKKHANDSYYSFFVPTFSTTSRINETVFQITLLEAYKKAFTYVGESGCGIPAITLNGTKNDWVLIHQKLDILDDFGMTNWKESLKPILTEFIAVYDGKTNIEFWKNIFKTASEYNGFYISGWIIKFFPYINTIKNVDYENDYDAERGGYRAEKGLKPNPFLNGNLYLRSTLSTADLPKGISKIDITWHNYLDDETSILTLCGGYFGMLQHQDKSLEPFVTWAVYDRAAPNFTEKLNYRKREKLSHNEDYWSPNIARNTTSLAIYDNKRFDSQDQSLAYIKQLLLDSLNQNATIKQEAYKGLKIEMIVLSDGSFGKIKILHTQSKQAVDTYLDIYVKQVLYGLPEKWLPALAHPSDILKLMDAPEDSKTLKVTANSKVEITL